MPLKSGIGISVLFLALGYAPFAVSQHAPGEAVVAPVPSQIFTAKKIFIANAVGDSDISPDHIGGGPDRAYNELYAGFKSLAWYELESTPAGSELVFEIDFTAPLSFTNALQRPSPRPQFRLIIRDPKTQTVLWSFIEYLDRQKVAGKWTQDKAFDQAILSLVADFKKLATPVGTATTDWRPSEALSSSQSDVPALAPFGARCEPRVALG